MSPGAPGTELAPAAPSEQPHCGSCSPAGGKDWIPVLALLLPSARVPARRQSDTAVTDRWVCTDHWTPAVLWSSHPLCSLERGIPATALAASQDFCPTQDPLGTQPPPAARDSPPEVAKAELGPSYWVTPTPGGLSCSPSPKGAAAGGPGQFSGSDRGEGTKRMGIHWWNCLRLGRGDKSSLEGATKGQ